MHVFHDGLERMEFAVALQDYDTRVAAFDDFFEDRPDGFHDMVAVTVFPSIGFFHKSATCEVNLANSVQRKLIKKFVGVEAVIERVIENVSGIKKQCAIRLFCEPPKVCRF